MNTKNFFTTVILATGDRFFWVIHASCWGSAFDMMCAAFPAWHGFSIICDRAPVDGDTIQG